MKTEEKKAEGSDEYRPTSPQSAPGEQRAEEDSRVFTFACFPAERVGILFGMLLGPAVGFLTIANYRQRARLLGVTVNEIFAFYPRARLLAGATLLVALVLVLFGAFYLHFRATKQLILSPTSIRYERRGIPPYGWLAKRVVLDWSRLLQVAFRERRRLLSRRPEVVLRTKCRQIVIPLSEAWEEKPGRKRPWLAKKPAGPKGWENHPLMQAVQRRWETQRPDLPDGTVESDNPGGTQENNRSEQRDVRPEGLAQGENGGRVPEGTRSEWSDVGANRENKDQQGGGTPM